MDIVLKRIGNKIGLYIDDNLATVLENESVDSVIVWINKNFKNARIHTGEIYKQMS